MDLPFSDINISKMQLRSFYCSLFATQDKGIMRTIIGDRRIIQILNFMPAYKMSWLFFAIL